MTTFSGFGRIAAALRNPNYGIYTAGSCVSLIGTWMQRIATGWLAWELTHSGAWLGLIAFADLFPTVVVGPIAGAAADRWNRLRVTKISQTLGMFQAFALFGLTAAGWMDIWLLFALTLFLGTVAAFNQPARLALIPSLVPREHLGAAVAINSVVFNLARFIGPAIAGVAIVAGGVALAFALNAVSFAFFLFALSRVRLAREEGSGRKRQGLLSALTEGVGYVVRHAGIAPLLLLLIVTSIGVRPLVELMPAFASRVFASGAEGLALLTASVGVGAIIGGTWLAGRSDSKGLTGVVLWSVAGMGGVTILFALSDRLWFAAPLLVVSGFFVVCAGVGTQTLIQLAVDAEMRGRVLSLYGLIFRGGPAIGALLIGTASDFVGLRWPVIAGATLVLLAWAVARTRAAAIRGSLEAPPADGPPPEGPARS
ncbi:MAG: MFS transporter [Bauldia litoralis]